MATMNISLPESLKGFIDTQVEQGGYSTSSEYIRELVREDRRRKLEQHLNSLLVEGLESGEPVVADEAYWEARFRALES